MGERNMSNQRGPLKDKRLYSLLLICYFIIYFLAAGLELPLGKLANYLLGISYTLLLIIFGLLNRKKLFSKLSWKDFFVGLILGLAILLAELLILFIFMVINHVHIGSLNTINIMALVKKQPVFMVYVILIAPLLEELVFRQALFVMFYNGIDKVISNKIKPRVIWWLSALLVGLVFGMVHGDSTILPYLLISIYLQGIYHRYKDIRVGMISHFIFNLLTVLLLTMR